MRLGEVYDHFIGSAAWVDPAKTADAIEVGTRDRPVRRIGTGWSACAPNLAAAAADGCDLFITHEPCFCEVWEPDGRFRDTAWGKRRASIMAEADMALMALHDTWDVWPTYGIRDSWMRFLGLTRPVALRRYHADKPEGLSLHEIPATTLDDYARSVAARIRPLGAEGVTVMGDGDATVRKVAIGVGCWIPTFEMLELGADVMIQVFDRAYQTFTRLPLLDLGAHLIVVEHGIVEMPGMMGMAEYINATFPDLHATFYGHEHASRFVAAPPENTP